MVTDRTTEAESTRSTIMEVAGTVTMEAEGMDTMDMEATVRGAREVSQEVLHSAREVRSVRVEAFPKALVVEAVPRKDTREVSFDEDATPKVVINKSAEWRSVVD